MESSSNFAAGGPHLHPVTNSQVVRHPGPFRSRGGRGDPRTPKGSSLRRSPQRGRTKKRMIHLDTSVLVDALTGPRRSAPALRAAIVRGERVTLSTLRPSGFRGDGIAVPVVVPWRARQPRRYAVEPG